ncbi:hypothetical protein ABPG75_010528 [Micractinium tetrahymenae]
MCWHPNCCTWPPAARRTAQPNQPLGRGFLQLTSCLHLPPAFAHDCTLQPGSLRPTHTLRLRANSQLLAVDAALSRGGGHAAPGAGRALARRALRQGRAGPRGFVINTRGAGARRGAALQPPTPARLAGPCFLEQQGPVQLTAYAGAD